MQHSSHSTAFVMSAGGDCGSPTGKASCCHVVRSYCAKLIRMLLVARTGPLAATMRAVMLEGAVSPKGPLPDAYIGP